MRPTASHLLDPAVLSAMANMELIARSVVEGMLLGLHRSPVFGFSQEFAEYRSYRDGDDPRHIDWNVFSRSDRMVVKRFLGETNSHLMILLDSSASMGYGDGISKLRYGQMLAASLAYLAGRQHDAAGVIVFDEAVRGFRAPSTKAGSLTSVLKILEAAEPGSGTQYGPAFAQFPKLISRRGLVAVISDFYCEPQAMVDAIQPLALAGHDCIFFHVLDPAERAPASGKARLFEDVESGQTVEVSDAFLEHDYPAKVSAHIDALATAVGRVGGHHVALDTAEPLGRALRDYLLFRQRRR